MQLKKINENLEKEFAGRVRASLEDNIIHVTGELDSWDDVIKACTMASERYSKTHVVNDIRFTGAEIPETRVPSLNDKALDGKQVDVLVIGGGITGVTVLRELSKWNLKLLLVDKEADLAYHGSGRNDGQVHCGYDLSKGNLKHEYVLKGNAMYDKVCSELGIPFKRVGQYGGTLTDSRLAIKLFCFVKKHFHGIKDMEYLSAKRLYEIDPNLNPGLKFGTLNSSVGVVSPYELTIAYGENAIMNGAEISLNTYVKDMEVFDGVINKVMTNRGDIYPKVVINAAGVFAEDVAKMAEDRFFSIHPRRGTNSITDKKTGKYVKGVTSVKYHDPNAPKNTKGGGIIHTIHDNLLLGPDAVETYEKENFETRQESINVVFNKQEKACDKIKQSDIITYFTGVRAPTFEEDFILERGRAVKNIVHLAGIQSPGLTAAPAFAIDMAELTVNILKETMEVTENTSFNPVRKPIPCLKDMPLAERDRMIKENPDYGIIVCRCEEISKGEIIDALKSPLTVPTVDGVKKRVRPGMGRCQGGFCMPQVIKIISETMGIPEAEVLKGNTEAFISFGKTKGGEIDA